MTITERQRTDRRKGIGASDLPAIMGLDPWRTAYDVWAEKTGRLDGADVADSSEAARIGATLERGILDLAEHELGVRLVAPSSTFVRGVIRVHPDAFIERAEKGAPVVEAKLTSISEGWGRPRSSEVPDRVLIQVQAQLFATESETAHVARLLTARGVDFAIYTIQADRDLAAEIEYRAEDFWARHVLADTPPDGGPSPDVAPRLLRKAGKSIKLDPLLVEAERRAKSALDDAEATHATAKAALLAALGDAELATAGPYSITYRLCKRAGIDLDQVRGRFPEVAAQCATTSTYRRLEVRQKKGA